MGRAVRLARRGRGRVSPNPLVGAVVVDGGSIVGEGWHEGPGTPHAEVVALSQAGERARGSTVYCTLEPCDHVGRTPPCTEALLDAGVRRLVVAAQDPNPIVNGRGFARLRSSGVEVETGVLEAEARRDNAAFERHVTTGLPFVTWKVAASLDGKTAASDASSRWISGDDSREDVQRLRAASDAILVGSGTVVADDPSLTVRGPAVIPGRAPLRVVVDGTGRMRADAKVLDGSAPTFVATTDAADRERVAAWRAAGADVEVLERDDAGRVSLPELLARLGKRDVQGLLVEGGATLAWALVSAGLVDRVIAYVAPMLVGGAGAPGMLGGEGFAPITDALRLRFERIERMGDDLRVEADVHGDR